MIRTKHAFMFAVVTAFLFVAQISVVVFSNKTTPNHTVSNISFGESRDVYQATLAKNENKIGIRESIIGKLGTFTRNETSASVISSQDEVYVESEESVPAQAESQEQISAEPMAGYLYACDQSLYPVAGQPKEYIQSPIHSVTLVSAEGARVVTVDGTMQLQLDEYPHASHIPACVPKGVIGITLNGVLIGSPLSNENDAVISDYEVLESEELFHAMYEGGESTLLGYALDGFGIFASYEHGTTVRTENLDECHGHTHDIPWNGNVTSTYHYHMTDSYPYSVGCFRGSPVSSPF